jgi:hypothetical protein
MYTVWRENNVSLLMKLIILNCLFDNLATQIRLSNVLLVPVSGCVPMVGYVD